jgi:DNA gyrase/topoisomerase IV subunit A
MIHENAKKSEVQDGFTLLCVFMDHKLEAIQQRELANLHLHRARFHYSEVALEAHDIGGEIRRKTKKNTNDK